MTKRNWVVNQNGSSSVDDDQLGYGFVEGTDITNAVRLQIDAGANVKLMKFHA